MALTVAGLVERGEAGFGGDEGVAFPCRISPPQPVAPAATIVTKTSRKHTVLRLRNP